jgi:hypothetical protein
VNDLVMQTVSMHSTSAPSQQVIDPATTNPWLFQPAEVSLDLGGIGINESMKIGLYRDSPQR